MIENTNVSKTPSEVIETPKYIGVASVKVVAVNPNNSKLRSLGWDIPENAPEPVYVSETTLDDGTVRKSARVRFMAQIQDFDDKPVIALDFWIRPNPWLNRDGSKCQIIDSYGRTAWGTKEDIQAGKVPTYATGPANISTPYKPCHPGEERLVRFLMKYLCCTPFETFDRNAGVYVKNPKPGQLTIDDWKALCDGNAREIAGYLATQPDNLVKVILGVNQTDDNHSYQAFIDDVFIGNGAKPVNGEYTAAKKIIDTLIDDGYHDNYQYSAAPVKPFVVTPTEVSQFSDDNTDDDFGDPFEIGETDSVLDDLPL